MVGCKCKQEVLEYHWKQFLYHFKMNFRPAGYSSDEDGDEFGDFSFAGDTKSVREEQEDIVCDIYKKRLDLNNTPENKLYNAITYGNVECVKNELNSGTDVNCNLGNGYSPLYLAASHVKADIVEELLKQGANIKTCRDGFNCLMAVCEASNKNTISENVVNVIKKLLEYRIDTKAVDRKRRTALMLASAQGFPDVVKLLLPFSRIDGEDNQGYTALFYAVTNNNPEIAKILIEADANVNHTDVRLNDAKYYATVNDYQEVLKLFPEEEIELTANDLVDKSTSLEQLFENLEKNERPLFLNDVSLMLYGMQCDSLIPLFREKQISLDTFLCLDDDQLQNIGVKLSFQRDRILKGLYKFHKHSFMQRSMPSVCAEDAFSTYDVLITVANCIKHLMVMEASLKYMRKNLERDEIKAEDLEPLKNVIQKFKQVNYITKSLKRTSAVYDGAIPHQPDLITKDSKLPKNNFKWIIFKWLALASISTVPFVFYFRNNKL